MSARAGALLLALVALIAIFPQTSIDYDVAIPALAPDGFTALETSSQSLELLGAWGKDRLNIRIISSGSQTFDEALVKGVEVWYGAVRTFTAGYGYRYLLSLGYTFISEGADADVVLQYVETLGGNTCGLTSLRFNGYTRMITKAYIQISKACVGSSATLAYKVAAHEFGHALGLGHSSYSRDLMYGYVNEASLPSTLDLYGLAVAYSWLETQSYRNPPTNTVSLPETIPYKYLEPTPPKLRVRIFMHSELGRNLVTSYDVDYGSTLSYSVLPEIAFTNLTKLLFTGWYRGAAKISDSPHLTVSVVEDLDLVARYDVYYFVQIVSLDNRFSGWVKIGEVLSFAAVQVSPLGEGVRLRFTGWSDNSTEPVRVINVTRPLMLEARYVKEFFVNITSYFDVVVGGGWYPEGSTAEVKVLNDTVFIGAGVRYRLASVDSDVSLEKSEPNTYRLVVTKPVKVSIEWVKEFYVSASSTHGNTVSVEGWYPEGTELELNTPDQIVWGNRTKAVFEGWLGLGSKETSVRVVVERPLEVRAVYRLHYYVEVISQLPLKTGSGWFERGSYAVFDADPVTRPAGEGVRYVFGGWGGRGGDPVLTLLVDGPKNIQALWVREFLLMVENPVETVNTWVREGEGVRVDAKPLIQLDEGRRLVFKAWAGDVGASGEVAVVVKVDRPRRVLQIYDEELLAAFAFHDAGGRGVEAVATLRHSSGRTYIVDSAAIWVLKGTYEIISITYKNVDVKELDHVSVEAPGHYVVPVKVYSLSLVVRDFLGMPFSGARVVVDNGEVVEAEAYLDRGGGGVLEDITYRAVNARLNTAFYGYSFTVDPSEGVQEVTLPLTPASTVIILTAAGSSAFLAYLRRKDKTTQS